jgi:hypothetical protein
MRFATRSDLNKIDWEVMNFQFWFDTEENPDKEKKKASGVFSSSIRYF